MRPNPHEHDYDLTHLVPSKDQTSENEVIARIEEDVPLRPQIRGSFLSPLQMKYKEALELMTPQKHSFLAERRDEHSILRAARVLNYTVTYRTESLRGVKMHRWWVLSHERKVKKKAASSDGNPTVL